MRATARVRISRTGPTRDLWQNKWNWSGQFQMSENFRRRTFKSFQRNVADILNVLHPLRGRVKAARGQVSESGEELSRCHELALCRGDMADVIANLLLFPLSQPVEFLFEPLSGFRIQPRQAFKYLLAVALLFGVRGA